MATKNTRKRKYHNIGGNYLQRSTKMPGASFSVIAVGGYKFARGITFEGLSVSYDLAHNSECMIPLCKWGDGFGYRPGYVDLSRLIYLPKI